MVDEKGRFVKGQTPWNKGMEFVSVEERRQRKIEADRKYKKSDNYKKWRAEYRKRSDVLAKERAQTISYRSQSDNHEKRTEYLNRPEVKTRNQMLARENKKRPEVIAQMKEYNNRPETKAKQSQCQKLRFQRPEVREQNNKWRQAYRKKNPYIYMRNRISGAIRISIKGNKKNRSWEELVGYTLAELMMHMEKRFTEGMTWDKFINGEIHIDHIIPVSRFNFESYADLDFKRCWALSNLQPMWGRENMSKGNRLTEPFQPCLALGAGI